MATDFSASGGGRDDGVVLWNTPSVEPTPDTEAATTEVVVEDVPIESAPPMPSAEQVAAWEQEGREAGYLEGYAQGFAKGQTEAEQELKQRTAELQTIFESFSRPLSLHYKYRCTAFD